MFTTFADGMKLSIMACALERNGWTAQLFISKILWFGVWSHLLLYLRALITTDYSGGSYLDTSLKSADAQECCNLWTLSGMYHRKWLVGFLVPFGLLTGTVELLFRSPLVEKCLFIILFLVPLFPFLPVSDAVGTPPKCPLLGWCILPSPAGSVGWVCSQLLLPPEYCSLLEGTTPNRDAWELEPHIQG